MGKHSGIGVLDKAVEILRATGPAPLGLADLCAATGLPRATVHRLASGLETHGLLARDSAGRWFPGPELAALAALEPDSLIAAAADVLPGLRDRTGESVQIYRPDGRSRVCVAVAEPLSGLRDGVPLGAVLPMTAGSGAKVLTAWADPQLREAILAEARFDADTLARVRERGWAESVGEREPGVASVSVPVRAHDGLVIAAVSVSGPVERISRRSGTEWAGMLSAAANALTARMRLTGKADRRRLTGEG